MNTEKRTIKIVESGSKKDSPEKIIQKLIHGSRKFYLRWEPTILVGESVVVTGFSTFGAIHYFSENNLSVAALIGLGGLTLSGIELWRARQQNKKTFHLQAEVKTLQKELDHDRQVIRIPRRENPPKS